MSSRNPRISKVKFRKIIKCFVMDIDATRAAEIAKVSRQCANRQYRHIRESIYKQSRFAPRFCGEVEIDQAEFGGRGRKRMQALLKRYAKQLPHREYMEKAKEIRKEHKVLVFGILQRQGRVYAHIVKRSNAKTLVPVIRLVVEDTSTIYSDQWRGFSKLSLDGYTHKSVNHSEEYVDSRGNHINGIEAFWSYAKRRVMKFNGIARTTLPLHIKECEWRYNLEGEFAHLKQKDRLKRIEEAVLSLLKS